MSDRVRIQRALLSVSDKSGLVELAQLLGEHGVKILSTGGTAKTLRDSGIAVQDVSDYTGFPEIQDGRVKTLHPKIHGGLLGIRGNSKHESQMSELGIQNIDLVVVNLYPFKETVAKGLDFDTCIENIDIGGPSMLRSAAKNHNAVCVLSSSAQYAAFREEFQANQGATSIAMRRKLAAAAFEHTAQYDTMISAWFKTQL
jgi:phosphoribosylaminoimidazolecarboxamide formyltransferase / IMP cyclohydrolase